MPKQNKPEKEGMFTMDSARRGKLKENFKEYRKQAVDKHIRIKAITGKTEQWGVSADENVRTQLLRTGFKLMSKKERRRAYFQRTHQGVLAYRTGSRVLTKTYKQTDLKTPKHALAAHTPGLKTQVVAGTKGAITDEHGTRDILRAGAVEKTMQDKKRHFSDVATVGKLGTIQLMMSPEPELKRARKSITASSAPALHSVYPKIGDISKKKNYDRFKSTVHEVREREKLVAAKYLLEAGRDNLVPKQHKRSLKRSGNDVSKALEYQRGKSKKTTSTFKFNDSSYSATDRLDRRSLRRMDRDAGKGKDRSRALSPPRHLPDRPKNFPFKG